MSNIDPYQRVEKTGGDPLIGQKQGWSIFSWIDPLRLDRKPLSRSLHFNRYCMFLSISIRHFYLAGNRIS